MNNGKPLGSNGVGRTGLGLNNGVIGNESQTSMAVYAIVVPEEEVVTAKRQATVALAGPIRKVPKHVHELQASNGSHLQQGSVEQARANSDAKDTGQCNQYSMNNAYGYPLISTNNFYSFAMNNKGYGSGFSSSGCDAMRGNSLWQRSSKSAQLSIGESKNPNQLIEDSIRLVNKCIEEKNWKRCCQEAQKGLAIPGVRDEQKAALYNHLSLAFNKLKDYEGAKQASEAGLGLLGVCDDQKGKLYNNLGFACNGLKDYEGGKQASEAGLGLLGARDNKKGKFYNNLGFACNGLKDYEGAKQASKAGLAIPGASDGLKGQLYNVLGFACNGLKDYKGAKEAWQGGLAIPGVCDESKRRLYSYLCFVCNELKDYEGVKQACEARLAIPGDSDKEKRSLYTYLSFACRALKNYEGVKQACEAWCKIPGGSNELKSYSYKNLSFACFKLGNNGDALKNAVIGLTFSESNIIHKVFFLAILVKCNSENNPTEELQAIARMLKAFMDINNDVMEKNKAVKRFSEVISIEELMGKLKRMLGTNVELEFEASVLEQIELLDNMVQRIAEVT